MLGRFHFTVLFFVLILMVYQLIAEFKDYALYTTPIYVASTDTGVIIDDLIIENCPWNHMGLMAQDTSGTPADSVNAIAKWIIYDRDFNLIFVYPLDSIVISDSGTWYDVKNFTPPTIGHYADLGIFPAAGFKVGNSIKFSIRSGCYYQKVDVRQ